MKIYIAIEHINGEIEGIPFIIRKRNKYKYWLEGYLIYEIDIIKKIIKEVNYND